MFNLITASYFNSEINRMEGYVLYNQRLNYSGYSGLVYADDIVMYSHSRQIDSAIASLNDILYSLHDVLSFSSFSLAPEKCNSLIFSRQQNIQSYATTLNGYTITYIPNYLSLNMDSKLRWSPHLHDIFLYELHQHPFRYNKYIFKSTNNYNIECFIFF